MSIGQVLIFNKSLSLIERLYIKIFGVPINGLRIRARRILPLITLKYKNILDAGCGSGVFTFEIAKKLPDSKITGIDIDNQIIQINKKITQKAGFKNCFFENQDICKMNIKNKFDLIISIDTLEHIKNDFVVLKNFYNALIKEGKIIIHVPGYYRRWFFFGWSKNFYVKGHYRLGYTKQQITQKIKKAGFVILDSYYTYGWMETITNNISYLITKAEMKNKFAYAFVFPILNFLSYFGRNSMPKKGAGVLVTAKKINE